MAKGKKRDKGKDSKPAKKAPIAFDLSDFTCPCCSRRCPLSKPKCGKGKKVAKKRSEKRSKAA